MLTLAFLHSLSSQDGSLDEGTFLPLREEFVGSLCIAEELGFFNCIRHLSQMCKEPEYVSGHEWITQAETELRALQLDPEGKGSSMLHSHDEDDDDDDDDDGCGCHGDEQNQTYQQNEVDCSDCSSGSDSEEGTVV